MSSQLATLYSKFGRTYPKGSVIFLENERGEEMFIILSGKVQISKRVEVRKKIGSTWVREGTEEKILATLNPGDFLGEMSLLNDKPRSAKAVAVETTKVIVLNRQNFERILESQPKLAIKMLKTMSNRVRNLDKMIGWSLEEAQPTHEIIEEEEEKEERKEKPQEEATTIHPLERIDNYLVQGILSYVLLLAHRLSLFDYLKEEEKTAEALAHELGWDEKKTEVYLRLLTALGFLIHFDGSFASLPLTTRTLSKVGNMYIGGTLKLYDELLNALSQGEKALSTPSFLPEEKKIPFISSFFEHGLFKIGEAVDFLSDHLQREIRKFVEVSPVSGSYALELHKKFPQAEGLIVGLEGKEEEIKAFLETFQLLPNMTVQTISPEKCVFPQAQDLFVLSFPSVLVEDQEAFLEKTTRSLGSGGYLFLHDFFLSDDRTAPHRAVLFEWLLALLAGKGPFLSTSSVEAKVSSLKLRSLVSLNLPDGTTCLLFQKK